MQPIHQTIAFGRLAAVLTTALLCLTLAMTAVSAQPKPTTGYAPVHGLKMYYEVHGPLTESPLPLEPADAGPRVQASLASPYAGPRREEVTK